MALDSGYFEGGEKKMSYKEAAVMLVHLYAEYRVANYDNEDYAKAVAMAVAALGAKEE